MSILALLDWRWPIKCQRTSEGICGAEEEEEEEQ